MLSRIIATALSPRLLARTSIAASVFSVTLGLVEGEPMSTLSFAGLCVSIICAAVLGAVTIHDIQQRLDALDAQKETPQ